MTQRNSMIPAILWSQLFDDPQLSDDPKLFDDPQVFDDQLEVWSLIIQKSTVIPPSLMVLFSCVYALLLRLANVANYAFLAQLFYLKNCGCWICLTSIKSTWDSQFSGHFYINTTSLNKCPSYLLFLEGWSVSYNWMSIRTMKLTQGKGRNKRDT